MELGGKVVLVTGGAGALGRALGQACLDAGAQLAVLDRDRASLEQAWPTGARGMMAVAADLGDGAAVARACDAVVARLGRIDALCNIAGGFAMGPAVHETSDDAWRSMLEINVGTLLNAVRCVVPHMLAGGGGRIVNVGSGAGQSGRPRMGAYSAAKSAVIRLTEAMALELREQGINVNCVLPSILDTPANRAAMPDADPARWVAAADLAQVIVFLCSDRARAVHGAAIPVVGLS